jgi:hypothetical protein
LRLRRAVGLGFPCRPIARSLKNPRAGSGILVEGRPAIVGARLSRGQAMLRARLGRQGIRITDAAVGAWLDAEPSPAAVPQGFVDAFVEAASRWAAGGADAGVGIHPRILALAREILEGGHKEAL